MKKIILASAIAVGCVGFGGAQAQAPVQPVDVVAVRQAAMGGAYGTWRALNSGVAAKADPKDYILAAKGLATLGRQIPALFPPAAGVGRLGLPGITDNRAGFELAAAALVTAAEALLKVAQANNAEAFPAAVKAVSDACGGCHPRNFARNWNE